MQKERTKKGKTEIRLLQNHKSKKIGRTLGHNKNQNIKNKET